MNYHEEEHLIMQQGQYTLEAIYKENYALLLNYGLKFSRDKELVRDCIQDIFVKMHRSKILPQTSRVRSYLLTALRRTLYDRIYSARETADLELVFQLPDSDDLFEQFFSKNDDEMLLARRLLDAIRALSSNQRTAIYLRFVRELSYPEIAEAMDMKVQSSMNLVSRALTKLRTLLKNDYFILLLLLVGK